MANPKHMKFLKMGVDAWNLWRRNNRNITPDLRRAKLVGMRLREADLSEADLSAANLSETTLIGADLRAANLGEADLYAANLSDALLNEAILYRTNLNGALLIGADFNECRMGWTSIGDVDLSMTKGLSTIFHDGPSTIGLDTIYRSGGKVPKGFLRGAGVAENFVNDMKRLANKGFQSCFISYSSKDHTFAERLHADLRAKGVQCWFAPKDLRIGSKLRSSFDDAIRLHDKLMVLLSKNSVKSPWVEKEVETAFEREGRQKKIVLFPIRIDDAVMETKQAWAADIRRSRHIGDFRRWKNRAAYKEAFDGLLRDLKADLTAGTLIPK
jgi:hypothetical protein